MAFGGGVRWSGGMCLCLVGCGVLWVVWSMLWVMGLVWMRVAGYGVGGVLVVVSIVVGVSGVLSVWWVACPCV
jgi:hypothetical protein